MANVEIGLPGTAGADALALPVAVLVSFVLGLVFWLVMLARTDSLGRSYLWPLYPFNWPALRSVLIREPVTGRVRRPAMLEPQNQWRSAH